MNMDKIDQIRAWLSGCPGREFTVTTLRNAVGGQPQMIRVALAKLAEIGEVVRIGHAPYRMVTGVPSRAEVLWRVT